MTPRQFAALLGFLFTAAWIGFSLGDAILCLVGAGVFAGLLYTAEAFLRGDIDLGEVQSRLRSAAPKTSTRQARAR
jgi:1,4-dihydroxy-2-naphthoate octaprenyltransferase